MQRATLSRFRAQWPAEAMGLCQSDPQVANYCNDAQDRLLMDPLCPDEGWYGGWITMNLTATVTNGVAYVVTPREIARLIVMGVCEHPIHIRNGFYEYLNYGAGLQPKTCRASGCGSTFQAFERDSVFTFTALSGTKTIRIYATDARDSGKRVLVQGKDANGQVVLTTNPGSALTAPGEYVVIQFPFVDTANIYSTIDGLQKDETYGQIQFTQVDPVTLVESALSTMEPTEGTALYRRYLINGIPNTNLCCQGLGTVQIRAEGRLDFVAVANETDYLVIPNIPALLEECQSIRFSRIDTPNAAQLSIIHHNRAIALLNGQLDAMHGKTNTSVLVPIFGSNKLTRQPV